MRNARARDVDVRFGKRTFSEEPAVNYSICLATCKADGTSRKPVVQVGGSGGLNRSWSKNMAFEKDFEYCDGCDSLKIMTLTRRFILFVSRRGLHENHHIDRVCILDWSRRQCAISNTDTQRVSWTHSDVSYHYRQPGLHSGHQLLCVLLIAVPA